MIVLRVVVLTLCAIGIAACAYAGGRLVGLIPPGKLPLYPSWVALHFISATLFCMLAPFQLWPALRARRPGLHRTLGRGGVAVGATMAVSGVAMAYASPGRPVSEVIFMSVFFLAYASCLALGLRAALARNLPSHRDWMVRMTAIALTPVTQRVIFPAFAAAIGIDGAETFWQIFISAAWIALMINLAVAEGWLRTAPARSVRSPPEVSQQGHNGPPPGWRSLA
ncbi:MAG TPA: DUF2306 domain-containing protein [Solirubrobacterales bacterium]|nr:DUF2306 domain-containing protein [Solirubrobacterales bacterium]